MFSGFCLLANTRRLVVKWSMIRLRYPEIETGCRDKQQRWWTLYQERDVLSDPLKRQKMLEARLAYQKCHMDFLTLLTTH